MTHKQQSLGQWGETTAARHLQQQGYTLIRSNWHCTYGEIDLVMQHGEMLVFVEVKTRRQSLSEAFASVTPAKREKLINAAESYLAAHYPEESPNWRIDVVGISGTPKQPLIHHVEDALDW